MQSRGLLLCLLLVPVAATPQDLPPGVLLVARVKAHVKEQMTHMPQYTCLETFERSHKAAGPKGQLMPQDTVRLEVLFSGSREFFDSPGGHNFKDDSPAPFIGSGLIGNGMFALILQILFVNDQGQFQYRGEEPLAGRRAAKWDFRIPLLQSGYTVSTASGKAVVATRGTFWADPDTFDLIRLEFRGDDIPPQLAISDVVTTMEYAPTRIGQSDVQLAQTGELRLLQTSGEESIDRFEFTHCRSFQSATSISFTEPGAAPDSAGPATRPVVSAAPLPAGLAITIAIETPITDRVAVGAPIEGRVTGNVIFQGKTVIPEGATVHGRIRRMDRYADMGGFFALGLEFTDIEAASISRRFFASLETAGPLAGFEWNMSNATTQTRSGAAAQISYIETQHIRVPALPGVGTFFMRGAHFEIPKGWKTVWKTQALN